MNGEIRPAIGDFPAGARIAGYQVEETIGRGGMAVVYRATDVRLDRMVALKILVPELARDDAFRQRFIRESRAAAAVDHPNVIPVFEAGEADGVLFIAMRYVTGRDVRALIEREGRLAPARVVSIVTQVASALDAAHAHGLVHRDVKPANMLLGTVASPGTADHIYLSDFGLSKLSVSAVSLTGTGQFLGTIDYMAPEQIEGRPVDGRTDLYALACTTFEMLTGQPPFQREQDMAVLWAQVSAAPPSARQLRPELPAEVDQVLTRALAKSPADRQASCLEFAAELRAACAIRAPGVPQVPAQPARPATELAYAPPGGGAAAPPAGGAAAPPAGAVGGAVSPAEGGPLLPPVGATAGPAGHEVTITEGMPGGSPRVTSLDPYAGPSGYGGYSGQGGSGYPPAGPPVPPRRRRKVLPVLLGLLVVLALVGGGLLVLRLRNGGGPSTTPSPHVTTITVSPSRSHSPTASPSSPAPATPAQVVQEYFTAINNHDYVTAYNLNRKAQSQESQTQFQAGFAGTLRDDLTISSVSGDVVYITLIAHQTDGTAKNYSGWYAVRNGVIVNSYVQQH